MIYNVSINNELIDRMSMTNKWGMGGSKCDKKI